MNRQPKVLDPSKSYTFSNYFELSFDIEDILADLDCAVQWQHLSLPQQSQPSDRLEDLHQQIQDGIQYVGLTSEQARREFLIAPIIRAACRITQQRVRVEYPILVNNWLKGTLDYYFPSHFLVIEAKRENLDNGLTQLATELLALDQWIDHDGDRLYGAVTTGQDWRFGIFERPSRIILADLKLYRVPEELDRLLAILIGILTDADLRD